MTDRSLARLAHVLFVAVAALFVGSIVHLLVSRPDITENTSWGSPGLLPNVLLGVAMASFPVVGFLIASRRPRNAIGWILLAIGAVWGAIAATDAYIVTGMAEPGSLPRTDLVIALSSWLWVPAVGLIGTYLLLLFPDGKLPSERWRKFAKATAVVMTIVSITVVLTPGPLVESGYPDVVNPLGAESWASVIEGLTFATILLPVLILVSAGSLVRRFRRSRGQERLQLKWLATAATLVAVIILAAMAAGLATGEMGSNAAPTWLQMLQNASLFSLALVPIAIGIALLRYRLYDIDLVINRTLVYVSLTGILAGAYVGLVFAFQALLAPVTKESDLAIAASTLVVAAMFRPARTRVQAFIDRRFYRRKFDAQRTLEDFGGHLRDEVDLTALSSRLTGVVTETMQPAHVSLRIKGQGAPIP